MNNGNIKLVIFDIDGTIKDLYSEHLIALEPALLSLGKRKSIVSFALAINKIGMFTFKLGLLPTSLFMQNLLLFIISIITFTNYYTLKQKYYEFYPKFPIFFNDAKSEIIDFKEKSTVILASTNHYTMNMKKNICKTFCVDEPKRKIFKSIIKECNVKPGEVLIVGDNLFDDYFPAKLLGTRIRIVNRYNIYAKSSLIKLLCKKST